MTLQQLPARILLVEDNKEDAEIAAKQLNDGHRLYQGIYSMPTFTLEQAHDGQQASDLLRRAIADFAPYHVILLDLELPEEAGKTPRTEVGFRLAREIGQAHGDYSAVVVHSRYADAETLKEVVRSCAVDFVPKAGYESREFLFASVAAAYRRIMAHRAELHERCRRSFQAEWRLRQSSQNWANSLFDVTSRGIGEILHRVESLEETVVTFAPERERMTLSDQFRCIREAARNTFAELQRVQSMNALAYGAPDVLYPTSCRVDDILESICEELRPIFVNQGAQLTKCYASYGIVTSVKHYLTPILGELVYNAVQFLPEGHNMTLAIEELATGKITVVVTDTGLPLSPDVREDIAKGLAFGPEAGRAWSLSLVRQAAQLLGASLSLEYRQGANVMSLSLS